MEKRVCLLLIINFYVFLFQNVNCSSGTSFFIWGGLRFYKKNKKNKINYFVFIIIIDPHVATTMRIPKKDVRNPDFLLSLLIIGSFSFKKISKNFFKKVKDFRKSKKFLCKAIWNSKFKAHVKKKFEIVQTRILETYNI